MARMRATSASSPPSKIRPQWIVVPLIPTPVPHVERSEIVAIKDEPKQLLRLLASLGNRFRVTGLCLAPTGHEQLRHWTAEAMAIVNDLIHWHILRLLHSRSFQADCRWIAGEIGTSVDQLNLALSRLLRLRLLEMAPSGNWRNLMGRGQPTEAQFNKLALIRIRELAAGDGIRLRRPAIK